MLSPPVGTIALLFTDVEGSTTLARTLGPAWRDVLADHHRLLEEAIAAEGGWVDGTEGDAFFATFADPASAGRAAVAAQRALRAHIWNDGVGADGLKVRMGLHVGYVERTATGYVGLEVHRAARIAGAAHGGQVLLSAIAAAHLADTVPTDQLGIHRLKDFPQAEPLHCAVIDGVGAGAFPPPRTESVRSTNLPARSPTLVGRDAEHGRISEALLEQHERLVTLTGRGGVGKTSLALAIGSDLLDAFPGGVWLVRLANLRAGGEVTGEVAAAVGAALDTSIPARDAVIARLRGHGRVLVILDNCEHLLEARTAVDELLEGLSQLQVLVTSQVPLRLADELVVPLDALGDDDALALMERVAHRRNLTLSFASADRGALLELVHLLDGLPLALEIAAARLVLLSPAALLKRLRGSDELITDIRGDRPERQRSLRATVDWSLGLLEPAPRALFARLAVFAAPVELEEIEAICGGEEVDVIAELFCLLEVALVRRVEAGDGRVRFGLPQGLRRIAADHLERDADADRWRRAHAERQREIAWVINKIGVAEREYEAATLATPERRVALRWARDADLELAQAIAIVHVTLAAERGDLREAREWHDWLHAHPPTVDDLVISYGIAMSYGAQFADIDDPVPYLDRSLALAHTTDQRVLVLMTRGHALAIDQRAPEALADAASATAAAAAAGTDAHALAQMFEAQIRLTAGDADGARSLLAEAVPILERSDGAQAWARFTILGDLELISGNHREALRLYVDSLREAERRGSTLQTLFDLRASAMALAGCGADGDAIELEAMVQCLAAELGPGTQISHSVAEANFDAVCERLGESRVAEAQARGRAVDPVGRVSRACELAEAAAVGATTGGSAPLP